MTHTEDLSRESLTGAVCPRAATCRHCGEPLRDGIVAAEFCCHGCAAAYQLLHDAGLDAFYAYRAQEEGARGARSHESHGFEEFDDPAFHAEFITELDSSQKRVQLILSGLHCRACVWLLEQLGRLEPSVVESRLNLHRRMLTVVWDSSQAPLSRIAALLARLGYEPHAARESERQRWERVEERRRLIRIAVAAAVAGNLMIVSVALYAGWFSGMAADMQQFLRWVSAGLGLVAVAWPGRSFFVQAWQGARARVPNMDMPIALGLGLGTVVGLVHTVRGQGEIYFDSLGMLIFLLLVGRWIQSRQHRRATELIQRLYELTPKRARRLSNEGACRWVPVSALQAGDRIELLAGETIPADGVVRQGHSAVDRSLLTGESIPVASGPGAEVHAGMINVDAALQIEVTAVGETSRLGKIIGLIEDASLRRTPIVQFADRLGGVFVVAVLFLTVLTGLGWAWLGSDHALDHAIALAIVACPCALGLATPLAVAVAIGRAARQQLLIKGGDTLERLARPGSVWFDKTGTLTAGRLAMVRWEGSRDTQADLLALEQHSSHPVARAVVRELSALLSDESSSELDPASIQQSEQGGIRGRVQDRWLCAGSLSYMQTQGIEVAADWGAWAERWAEAGESPILVAEAGCVVAGMTLGDQLRPESAAVVAELRRRGWQVGILSGDHPRVVRAVAEALQIDPSRALGGLLPEDKLRYLQRTEMSGDDRLRDDRGAGKSCAGPIVMVGDGMNDSAALAAADVGVSMQASAETSLASADVHLGREGLQPLLELLRGARQTVGTIRRALAISLAYNVIAVGLAMAGWINPLVAAVLMPVSSLSVLTLALTGQGFRERGRVVDRWRAETRGTDRPATTPEGSAESEPELIRSA